MTLGQLIKTIEKKEWQFVFIITLLVMVITTLPYLYGWLKTPAGKIYTGIHFLLPTDYPVYYSYIQQASQGRIIFEELFSSEMPSPTILNTIWLIPGFFSGVLNLSPILSFHLSRLLFIPFLMMVIYLLISYFFEVKGLRKLGFIFFIFASGFGFYYSILNYQQLASLITQGGYIWPADLWIVEAFTFLTLYYSPHFIASLALLLLTLLLIFLSFDNRKISYGFWSGFCALILFSFHPFHFVTLYSLPLIYLIIWFIVRRQFVWRKFASYLIMVLVSSPIFIYYFWLLQTDLLSQIRFLQNYCPTPRLFLMFMGYGGLLIFSIFSIIHLFYRRQLLLDKNLLIVSWLVVQAVLIYLPFSFQRRLNEGLAFPMVILTSLFLYQVYKKIKQKRPNTFLINPAVLFFLFLFIFLITPVIQISTDIFIYIRGEEPAYISIEERQAMNWLQDNITSENIIFASRDSGNLIPGFSGRRVYLGHGVETIYTELKKQEVDWFFSKNRDYLIEKSFLLKRNISYIYYSPREKLMGDYKPKDKPYLQPVYSNQEITIYQVI